MKTQQVFDYRWCKEQNEYKLLRIYYIYIIINEREEIFKNLVPKWNENDYLNLMVNDNSNKEKYEN